MPKEHALLLALLAFTNTILGCGASRQTTCPGASDGGGLDLGTGPEARACRSDDYYHLWFRAHMNLDRSIIIRTVEIARGWPDWEDSGELISRLLAEDGTILNETRMSDPMWCSASGGASCPPYPHAVDFWEAILMVPGAAFLELTDTVAGGPPIRIDLRGHVQLLCMNAPCELDVCKPLLRDAGSSDAFDQEVGP